MGLFWDYALPWLLQKLVDEGVIAAENATGIKTVEQLVDHLKELKTYPAGTPQKNNPFGH